MTSKERTRRSITFGSPDRIPLCLDFDLTHPVNRAYGERLRGQFDSDILQAMNTDPDFVPAREGEDEWGCIWESFGNTMGEVTGCPVRDWDTYEKWKKRAPDYAEADRYAAASKLRKENPDRFIMGGLGALMMSLIYFRGYEGYMTDIYLERNRLEDMIDLLYKSAYEQISGYAKAGMDAVIAWEDWGLQDRLMIDPVSWRLLFKEKMRAMIGRIHELGMFYILHSCGYVVDIIDDLIDIGVDVLQLDQQKLMGFDVLERYAGSVCFFCPADIQFMTANYDHDAIRRYCEKLVRSLSVPTGGFMYKAYAQPVSIGIPSESLEVECRTFSEITGDSHRGNA